MVTRAAAPALQLTEVSKAYGGAAALRAVSLTVEPGTVHALVGLNGAGKSTLIKILAGAVVPDSGWVELAGRRLPFGDPRMAQAQGLAFVFQDPALVPALTVADNLVLGAEPTWMKWWVDSSRETRRARQILDELGLAVDPDSALNTLQLHVQQTVAIARALLRHAHLLVLDEPTAYLDYAESEHLLQLMRQLAQAGNAVLFVSHRLDEVEQVADHVSVLRDGRMVFSGPRAVLTRDELVRQMTGAAVPAAGTSEPRPVQRGPTGPEVRPVEGDGARTVDATYLLHVEGLQVPGRVEMADIDVSAGEVVAVVGLAGAGQSDAARAIVGAAPGTARRVQYPDQRVGLPSSPAAALRRGVAFLPANRPREGLVPEMSVQDNLMLSRWGARPGRQFRPSQLGTSVQQTLQRLGVRPDGCGAWPIRQLSGGNQQKVLLGRAVLSEAQVFVLEEPTGGVDVASKAELQTLIRDLADHGRGVLIASSDIDEVLAVASRVIVVFRGRTTTDLPASMPTRHELLQACLGAFRGGRGQADVIRVGGGPAGGAP